MNQPPAFQFYVDNFVQGTCDMNCSEVGCYIRLLCYQWSNGSIPKEKGRLLRVAGGVVTKHVLAKFKICGDGLLRNERLEKEREKQVQYRKKQAEFGKSGGRPKKGSERVPFANPFPEQKGSQSSPSPSPSPSPSTEKKDASLSRGVSIQEVFDAWNSTAATYKLKQCLVISDKRRRTLEARFRDAFFVGAWQSALLKVAQSDFCKGTNERGWTASFDWFIQPDTVAKIMEGKYDNRSKTHQRINPRLEGVSRSPINDYAAAAARKIEEQDRRRLAAKMAETGNIAPSEAKGA